MKYLFPFALILITSGAALAAPRSVSLQLVGASEGPNDFEMAAYRASCMKNSGWEQHALVSKPRQDSGTKDSPTLKAFEKADIKPDDLDGFKKGQDVADKAARLNGKGDAAIPSCPPYKTDRASVTDQRAEGEKWAAFYVEYLKNLTQDLKKGDKFLLNVYAHGDSNCRSEYDSDTDGSKGTGATYDVTAGGIQNADHCDHAFQVIPPGCDRPIALPTKKLIPILKTLREKGVKTAVELQSCYGGAAIKDFAAAGVCAHAYTTPDAPLEMCINGNVQTPLSTGSPDMEMAYFCSKPGADKDIAGMEKAMGPLSLKSRRGCRDQARAAMTTLGPTMPKPLTEASLQDFLRVHDQTVNQPIGTDGPYWAVGALGLLGNGGQDLIDSGRNRHTIQCFFINSPEAFIKSMGDELEKVTQSILGNGCSFKGEWKKFIEANAASLTDFYAKWKALSRAHDAFEATEALPLVSGHSLPDLARDLAQAEIKANPKNFPDDKSKEMYLKMAQSNPSVFIKGNMMEYMAPHNPKAPPADPLKSKIFNTSFGGQTAFAAYVEKVRIVKETFAKNLAALRAKRAEINQMERKLYAQLKGSSEYAQCLKNLPEGQRKGMAAAKAGCEDFEI